LSWLGLVELSFSIRIFVLAENNLVFKTPNTAWRWERWRSGIEQTLAIQTTYNK
jgi:hypothetical protein